MDLIVLACPTNLRGEYIAAELAGPGAQTLENLAAFGERLADLHDRVLVPGGHCRCGQKATIGTEAKAKSKAKTGRKKTV